MGLLLDDKSIIYKPKPMPWGGDSVEGFPFKILHVCTRTCISGYAQYIPTNGHLGLTGHALNSEHAHRTS